MARYYILVGDADTWKISVANNLWGFSDKSKGSWNTCNMGDYLAFYVTAPIKKIFGFGVIKNKFTDENIVWPDEKLFGHTIWKHKIEFDKLCTINNWYRGIPIQGNIMLNTGRKVIAKDIFLSFLRQADQKWGKGFCRNLEE
jgi:hypothetical protein